MDVKKNVLAVIPARGGSKGIPRKNLRTLGGKPLIAWSIDAANQSKVIDRVIVSTEDPEIAEVAKDYGADVPFLRPKELASDVSLGMEPIFHALDLITDYKWVFLLQPTSPLRAAEDIDNIFTLCSNNNYKTSTSVCEVKKHPDWMFELGPKNKLVKYTKTELVEIRQDLKMLYQLNGALYLARIDWLKKHRHFVCDDTIGYVMPWERSVDIDDYSDLELAEYLINR